MTAAMFVVMKNADEDCFNMVLYRFIMVLTMKIWKYKWI